LLPTPPSGDLIGWCRCRTRAPGPIGKGNAYAEPVHYTLLLAEDERGFIADHQLQRGGPPEAPQLLPAQIPPDIRPCRRIRRAVSSRLHLTTDGVEGEIAMSAPQANTQVTLSLPILRKGQHAGEPPVERLQFMLNFVKGVDDLDVDGIFGPKTEAAVRDFQQNENLSVDGIVGRQTWTALLRRWVLFSQPG